MSNRRCAFALYAKGSSHEACAENVICGIRRHVPGVDVLRVDAERAMALLPPLSDRDCPYFIRMAIPLLDEMREYDRVIWLDVDVDIVSDRFADILDVETGSDGLAAVRDFLPRDRARAYMKKMFPEYNKSLYVNSGVIVFDMHKIDPENWKRRMSEGIKRWAKAPHTYHDQDVFNLMFEFKEIDGQFNTCWTRDRSAAALVHYVNGKGKEALSVLIRSRNAIREGGKWQKRCIVTSLRHDFIRPWIRAYFASGNTTPLVIVPNPPDDWGPGDMDYCYEAAKRTGGMVLDCTEEWQSAKRSAGRAVCKHVGWYTKKHILHAVATRLAPESWAWIDDDAELTGDIGECFDVAEQSPGFILAQFYYGNKDDARHPSELVILRKGKKLCWGSMVFYHGVASRLMARDLGQDFPVEDDEIVMAHLYEKDPEWHEGFCDFSMRGWQATCKRICDIPTDWSGKLLHYCSYEYKGEAKRYWANRVEDLPAAPFETDLPRIEGAVKATPAIGRGSRNKDHASRRLLGASKRMTSGERSALKHSGLRPIDRRGVGGQKNGGRFIVRKKGWRNV